MLGSGGTKPVGVMALEVPAGTGVMFGAGGAKPECGRTGGAPLWEVALEKEAIRWLVAKLSYVEVKSCLIGISGPVATERGGGA